MSKFDIAMAVIVWAAIGALAGLVGGYFEDAESLQEAAALGAFAGVVFALSVYVLTFGRDGQNR
jgi:ABC-type Mn2+/Zn2+ transport system permease subunit